MKLYSSTALLVFVVAVGAYAVADNLPQPQTPVTNAPVKTDSTASSSRTTATFRRRRERRRTSRGWSRRKAPHSCKR